MALRYKRPIDTSIWHRDAKDVAWKRRWKQRRRTSTRSNTVGALLGAARALTERENPIEYAGAIANYLGVTREQLYSMPLAEFIDRYESAQLTEEINEAYDEELEQEDEEFLAHVKSYQGHVLNTADDD